MERVGRSSRRWAIRQSKGEALGENISQTASFLVSGSAEASLLWLYPLTFCVLRMLYEERA